MNELIPVLQNFIGLDNAAIVEFITDWGGPLGSWIVLQLVFIFAGLRQGLQLALIATIAFVTNSWLKWVFMEPRPFHINHDLVALGGVGDFGMPSGHAQGAAAFWGALGWLWRRRVWLLVSLISFAIVVGMTRIYLAAHSPAQVVVGLGLGFAIAYVVLARWDRLVERLSSIAWETRWWLLAAAIAITLLVGELILSFNSGFVAPQRWIEGFARAEGIDTATAADLLLFVNSTLIIGGIGAGFGALALLNERWSCEIAGAKSRWLCFLGAIVGNVLALTALGFALEQRIAVLGFAVSVLYPLVALYLPMRIFRAR